MKKRILIVDDEKNIRELVKINLEAEGYAVSEAENGRDALRIMREERPDLVILDIMMPVMDGWETAKRIRDDYELGATKILMLTAKSGEKDKMIGKDILKADEYMSKPFDIDELLNTVKSMLGI